MGWRRGLHPPLYDEFKVKGKYQVISVVAVKGMEGARSATGIAFTATQKKWGEVHENLQEK